MAKGKRKKGRKGKGVKRSVRLIRVPRRRSWSAGETTSLLRGWLTTSVSIDSDLSSQLQAMRSRSRHECQNNDHVRNFLRLVRVNVVGQHGIQMQGRVKMRNGRPDDRANAALEEAWREWGRRGVCDVTGQYSWRQIQRLWVETIARDGECILRKHIDPENGGRFAVELIDPESLDVTYSETLPNGNRVAMGVELNGVRRPVAYYLAPEGSSVHGRVVRAQDRARVPAEQILHGYLPEYIWQTRGVPWTATSLTRLHNLDGYEEAEVVAARTASAKMAAYVLDPEAETEFTGDGEDSMGAPLDEVMPGQMPILPPGWDVKAIDWNHPNTAFGAFVKETLRGIASGLGVNYNSLANDLEGVNYTSLRHGMLLERDIWMSLQDWVVETLCEPVFRAWLVPALEFGAVRPQTGAPFSGERLRDFQRVTWQPRRWQWVDPQKDIAAAREAYELRTRSLSSIIREQGLDPDEVWDEIARDEQRMIEKGVTPPTTKEVATDGNPQEPDGDEAQS